MTDSILQHATILAPGEVIHLTRAALGTSRPRRLHGHDFFELLWVQNGRIWHHIPGTKTEVGEGQLLFLRPSDRHALQARGDGALVVSLTLHPDLIAGLADRHPRLAGHLFWSTADAPANRPRTSRQIAEINQAALRLERSARDLLAAEAFLLPLCAGLMDEVVPLPVGAPDWLIAACAASADPNVFRDGAAGLARVAGRAHPHVSRTMRRYLDQSPSDYINARRMDFAARRLAGSTDSLAEIAADCGIPNLSHFHKLFRAQFGTTPQRYRHSRQTDVIQT